MTLFNSFKKNKNTNSNITFVSKTKALQSLLDNVVKTIYKVNTTDYR